jgi:hypothetical protein
LNRGQTEQRPAHRAGRWRAEVIHDHARVRYREHALLRKRSRVVWNFVAWSR